MTVKEFVNSIVLHDSLLESIDVCTDQKTITLTLDFCLWQQPNYQEGTPETEIIKLLFLDVENYTLDAGELNSDEVVGCTCIEDNTITIQAINDLAGDCRSYTIKARNIIIEMP